MRLHNDFTPAAQTGYDRLMADTDTRGPNETDWLILCADLGEDDAELNTAMVGAMLTSQRFTADSRGWVSMGSTEAWERLYGYALDNYRELVTL